MSEGPTDAERAQGEQDVADVYNDALDRALADMTAERDAFQKQLLLTENHWYDLKHENRILTAERDAERARAEAAEAWARDVDLKNNMLHLVENERVDVANALKKALAELECANSDARAQIVRLMAKRDEARASLADSCKANQLLIDRLTPFLAAEQKAAEPALAHNPFRAPTDAPRRIGARFP